MNKLSMGVFRCSSVSEILKYIRAITSHRAPIRYGVEKVEGKSYDRLRREANQKAIDLLNSLVDGATLTDEQRQILAGYTGEGGIGGSVSEYYTPKPIAEGVWEIMKLYGADVGNTLEPSAGTGVFNETKPVGTVMTATEISSVSGRINQLLHPEDSVQISPFEQLAISTPNDSFDHVVGNVPFGGRDNTRNIDKPYAEETDMGSYFMLRMLDKIKPGGFMCVIVPPSIVSGSNMKRLRLRLSRKAEFLGAHRLPTGTFDANGTSTVVDVVLMRKHPAEMAEKIPLVDEGTLESANVLWPTFISGKWFEKDGRRFVHGTQEKGFQGRIEVRADGQIDNQALKAKLIHRFESRIDWSLLDMAEPSPTADVVGEGEMRLINGVWQKYAGGRWIEADAGKELKIDAASYGADSWEALQRNLTTTEGRLGMTFTQMANVRDKYTTSISDDMVQLVDWINSQPEKYRERLYRGAMIGRMLIEYQDMKAAGHSAEQIEQQRLSLVSRLQAEIDRFGNPGRGSIAKLSGSGARAWFAFRGAIKLDGTISDELTGKLVTHDSSASYDSTSYQDTLRYLYSDLTRDPIQLDDFRLAFTGELPASDDELLNLLASTPGIAVSPYGGIVPFARATSGDINEIVAPKQEFLATLPDGPVKNNVLNQLAAIEEKRIKTPAENIRFKLNSRWFDRSVILEFLQENGYPDLRYVQSVQLEGDEMVSDTYHGGDGLFVGHRYGVVQRKDKETGEIRYEWDRKSGENATGFPAQLEKYLNGARIGGKDSATANGYREQMALLEDQFNKWIKTHDRYDELVAKYNDVFNSNIPYEHSGDPLGLKGLSGKRQPFDYQNSEVRRLSEDGRGILGFGTGLGKTTTALALEAFNYENGRSTRTAYVVPKSVLENWYYEAKEFLSEEAFSNYLFVGLDVLMDGDQIRQVPVLDENGKPVLGTDGTPVMRDALKLADEATITARMNAIPHSNYRAVVFTKEQYARIPLRDDTVDEHAQDMLYDFVAAGRVASAMDSDSHRKEAARRRVLSEYSDTGTEKAEKYAKLIATLKEFFPEGKQIIFTDEKTQHQKLKRIICNALNLEPSKVGILNAQTVAEAGKTGKKLKAVKPPKELPDEPTDAQIAKYNEQMALYDAYIAQQNEMSLGGLEKIAADFQEGRTPIIICNKKAEVGINLHRGTTDIHHLTLPWTPASIAQRNGRGARVGSNRASVRVHYYCGKGSFDEYRLKTLKRKAGWISDILRSDKSEMENADANDMIEMQMYTAKDDGERLAMMQVQMDKAKAAKRARQKEQATIDLQNYIKAQHAAGEDVEVLTAELERSKAELEKTTAEVAKFKQAVMAKAADNADWKARWGSVHHTDRTLLAQYRASLKSAIQRKANISQAISRYEKLLNRTQKAATDIKRLRPLVEDAINKGILDVDPDLVNHANEFLVIGDRSWRVGQYYDCAGDIVRIKSLDFDSQRADVEIIFTLRGTKSGNWDVKTLDKQVDVTPDEDAVMQKISGGVSIAGINDIISCDDFYRFQQRGMIKITDSYGVQTTESGYSIDFVGTYTDPLKHAVYPDRRDGALKSSIAKWVLGMMSEGNNRQIRSAETFLVELFGSNYGDVIASYGDTLSPEAIQEKIADAIARMPEKTSQGSTRNGDSELEVTNAIFGTNEFRASDYEITTAQFGTIGIYSNKDEIKQAMDAASARIAAERKANLNHAVAALTQSWVTAIREAATTGKITPAIADVVNDGSKFMDAYKMDAVQLPSAYGQLSYRMTYNLVSMFTDLAILGLVDLNEVTPELLSMRKNHVEILQRINTVLAGRTDEEKQADADRINLALGNITEEEIAARNEKQEELSSIQGDATSIAQSLGLNYRVSTADLKMMYAPKFAAGEVFGLQEASGMKGVLFRAKDAIKAKFGARWLPAKAKNSDFPGNWWIIETKHNVADVLAVIQQYA
ncbi:N-6 DNA methylase [Escherichia coli]|nr:N-6 DNA methylase [Escherichia coli]MDF8564239.1 N-6 DNA methylase [Escherichia coli]